MSYLPKLSVFYYGILITKANQNINFDEGGGELTAVLPIGDYTHSEIVVEIAKAMTLAGALDYTSTFNRTTRKITIAAPSAFDLLTNTGSQVGTSPWELFGFDTASDHTGLLTYTSEDPAGSEYRPQLILGDYIQPEDYEVKESSVVSMSTNGIVQTIQFGDGQRMQCNIRGATDLTDQLTNDLFFENATGVSDLRTFMKYLITKSKVEFMPDVDTRSTFYKMLLESTPADKSGTKFMIKNMDGAQKHFETGTLQFRKVIS